MTGPTNILWYSSVAVQFLFCLYLIWTRLFKTYPAFTLYLGCAVVRSVGAMQYAVKPDGSLPLSYTYFWLWTEPVLLALQIAVAFEVHSRLWKGYGGIVKSTRPLLVFGLLTALVFAALPVRGELRGLRAIPLQTIMHFEFLAKRYLSTVLAVLLVLSALLFLMVINNSLKRISFRHEGMLAVYFGIYAVAYLVVNMGWKPAIRVNEYMLSALTVCLVIWISVFQPSQELASSKTESSP